MRQINTQTKIIATLGPVSSSKAILRQLIDAGVDVFRLNFSHSRKSEHLKLINFIKELNIELKSSVAILADLQGPKLRVGEIESDLIVLYEGDIVTFVTEKCIGTKDHIYVNYSRFCQYVNVGEAILIDDGKIKLEITETNKTNSVKAKVIYGGPLSSKKGINLPNTQLQLPCLTEDDISNANFALRHGVDWIALSFVRKASDILELSNLIKARKGHAGVIAKIEKPEALLEIDRIIDLADGIMVARGDLGVEIPFDEVPLIQKLIVERCIACCKPVIIATQMMESMITNFRPTRAEANDVANAVFDGADALMLSAKTSIGQYPVETIYNMQKIIAYTETHGKLIAKDHIPLPGTPTFLADSICLSASQLARQVEAKAVITFTHSGYTAIRISSYRAASTIYAFTNNKTLLNKISLIWGIRSFYLNKYNQIDRAILESTETLLKNNLLQKGDCIVHVGSTPLVLHQKSNLIKVNYV